MPERPATSSLEIYPFNDKATLLYNNVEVAGKAVLRYQI